MEHLVELFICGKLRGNDKSAIKIKLIPSEVAESRQYRVHLLNILKLNKQGKSKEDVKKAEEFIQKLSLKQEKARGKNQKKSMDILHSTKIPLPAQNLSSTRPIERILLSTQEKENFEGILSSSPIYALKSASTEENEVSRYLEKEQAVLVMKKSRELLAYCLEAWRSHAAHRAAVMRNFQQKKEDSLKRKSFLFLFIFMNDLRQKGEEIYKSQARYSKQKSFKLWRLRYRDRLLLKMSSNFYKFQAREFLKLWLNTTKAAQLHSRHLLQAWWSPVFSELKRQLRLRDLCRLLKTIIIRKNANYLMLMMAHAGLETDITASLISLRLTQRLNKLKQELGFSSDDFLVSPVKKNYSNNTSMLKASQVLSKEIEPSKENLKIFSNCSSLRGSMEMKIQQNRIFSRKTYFDYINLLYNNSIQLI